MVEYKVSEYAGKHRVTTRTVWRWIKEGIVKIRRTQTGRVRVVVDENREKRVAVYARVSSSENKDNLERQMERLVSYCNAKGYRVQAAVSEVGSALNDRRPKLERLLTDNNIDVIVVEHKDRLCRFGSNYIEKLLALQGREIEVVNPVLDDKEDLVQDFVSIITSFCARLYGQRRTRRRTERLIRELEGVKDDTD